ncbi:MAG: hypothetical protein ACOCXJ_07280 [Planctomycetota bacterium]
MSVTALMLRRDQVDQSVADGLWHCFHPVFPSVSRATFEADRNAKSHVLVLWSGEEIVGFTALHRHLVDTPVPAQVLCSGDTIVAPEHWGSLDWFRVWLRQVQTWMREDPARPCYWLLLCSGFRTYRFMSMAWRAFIPHPRRPPDAELLGLLDAWARHCYRDLYDPQHAVVRFPDPQILRPDLARIPAPRLRDPAVQCFLAANPHHDRGDELVCLAPITAANQSPACRRLLPLTECGS